MGLAWKVIWCLQVKPKKDWCKGSFKGKSNPYNDIMHFATVNTASITVESRYGYSSDMPPSFSKHTWTGSVSLTCCALQETLLTFSVGDHHSCLWSSIHCTDIFKLPEWWFLSEEAAFIKSRVMAWKWFKRPRVNEPQFMTFFQWFYTSENIDEHVLFQVCQQIRFRVTMRRTTGASCTLAS